MATDFSNISLSKTWKATLQAYPSKSTLSLKNLWELIYDDQGRLLIDTATSGTTLNTSIGCKLDHNIICYSKLEYATSSASEANVSYKSSDLSKEHAYELLAIDASIAKYDTRAKTRKVQNDNTAIPNSLGANSVTAAVGSTNAIFANEEYICHDKNSVLRPASMEDFIKNAVFVDSSFSISKVYYGLTGGGYYAPAVMPLSSEDKYSYPIYLNKPDTAFRGTLSTDNTIDAYNLILFNPRNNLWVPSLVLKALYDQMLISSDSKSGILKRGLEIDLSFYREGDNNTINDLVNLVFTRLPQAIDSQDYTSDLSVNPDGAWADILKHTYIWIKAPFFADYINPEVFNQDLSSSSDVKHRNLVISDKADFNKYDETTSDADKTDKDTYPYIPKTGPGYDILTRTLYTQVTSGTRYTDKDSLNLFIKEGDKNENSLIGSLNFAGTLRNTIINTLPNYFDPEVDYSNGGLTNTDNYFPTVIPSSGNIFADGRIISPTIDELWIYIKQLTEGRRCDTTQVLSASEEDTARAINADTERVLDQDTILTSPVLSEYNVTGDHIGDVIDVSVIADKEGNNVITPISWVNNNSSIKYNIYSALNRISNTITTFQLKDDLTDKGISSREITNFTAWYKSDDKDNSVLENGDLASVSDDGNIWQPRKAAPYSLRELEALAKGNKYNIITLARFIENNFGVLGPLGYLYKNDETEDSIGTDKGVIQAAGSLYQFHRDYNFKVDNPNTFFRMNGIGDDLFNENGKNTTTSGMDASFNDLSAAVIGTPNYEGDLNLYNENRFNNKAHTEDISKTSKMPLLVENYGKSVYLSDDFGEYSGADIYMAADGTWRYKAEHSRIPILRSRY